MLPEPFAQLREGDEVGEGVVFANENVGEHVCLGSRHPAFALASRVRRIAQNLEFLGNVQGKKPSVEKVVDMVENARRRIKDQRRFDDGVARLYRAVEMWHQWRLQKRYSVSTDKVDWAHVGEQTSQRFLDAAGLAQLPVMLDLTRARTLDRLLSGDGLEEDNVFRDLLQQRNRSILAHGLKPIEEAPARRFLEYIDDMVDRPQLRSAAEHARLREI